MLLAQLTRQNADENTDENSGYAASPRHPALRRVATMLNRLQRGRSLFSPFARFPRSTSDQKERGAMMMLLAGNIVALVASGAVALDLSARMNSAQHLQNAADAASLAGVVVWVDTADETATRAKVAEMTEQNGVDRPDIVVDVTFVDSTTRRLDDYRSQPDTGQHNRIPCDRTTWRPKSHSDGIFRQMQRHLWRHNPHSRTLSADRRRRFR